MPYIAGEERSALDGKVQALAKEITDELSRGANNETEVSVCYRRSFLAVGKTLVGLERGAKVSAPASGAAKLALAIFGSSAQTAKYKGLWMGRLNYSLTRLIQEVPKEMVERGAWKEEFRYWVYVQTVGALSRAAIECDSLGADWPVDGLVGVLVDVKDEYKRRVNSAYEAVQIKKNGDCYTTPYRTELSEVKGDAGGRIGYTEVMKDFRKASS